MKKYSEFINEARTKTYKDIPKECQGGDCYEVGYNYFNKNYHKNNNLRLCHGLVTGQGKIECIVFNHCWVEDIVKKEVFDLTMPECFSHLSKETYYLFGRIKEENVFRYDYDEVLDKSSMEGTYGPWEDVLKNNKY